MHQRRLASDEFLNVLPGYCTPSAAPASLAVIVRTLQHRLLPGAVISDVTAAELLGYPLPPSLTYASTGVLHCTVPPQSRRRCGPTVRVHRRAPRRTRSWRGLQLSEDLSLLCELAGDLSHEQLVACCDHAVGPRAERPRVNLEELRRRAATDSGLHGIKSARLALADARERVESPRETALRLLLLDRGFAEPIVNLPVQAPGTGESFRIDLAYPSQRIAIEYDGDWHRTDRSRFRRDRRKDDVLHELGWRVVRVVDSDLLSPSAFLGRLEHLGAPRLR